MISDANAEAADALVQERIKHALSALKTSGRMSGQRTRRVSARLDPGLLAAAMERTGITSETALLEAALAVLAEPDDFGSWLISQRDALDKDFELAL